jgi:hypothetical protein
MLEIDWDAEKGWSAPKITPYHFLSISPAASALHYGIEVRFVAVLSVSTPVDMYRGCGVFSCCVGFCGVLCQCTDSLVFRLVSDPVVTHVHLFNSRPRLFLCHSASRA